MEACPYADIDTDASVRVDGFLDCVEDKRRQASRLQWLAAIAGMVIALAAYARGVDRMPTVVVQSAEAAEISLTGAAPLSLAR